MNVKKALKLFIVIAMIGILIYIFFGIKTQNPDQYTVVLNADGKTMEHFIFDKDQNKSIVLRSSEAHKEKGDKMVMKNVEGVIYKKGSMNKDINVSGKDGYVANKANTFYMENDARITSEDFDIRSRSFLLEDQAELHSERKVNYKAKDLVGIAREGMRYYLKTNVLKLFKTRGHYHRDQKDFEFKTDILWIIDEENLLVMEANAVIREKGSILRSGWISIHFTDKFKRITEAASQRESYFYLEDKEKHEIKEIKADNITSYYNEAGKLSKVAVLQHGEINLKDESNFTVILSNVVEMNFHPESGKLSSVNIPEPGQVENTGKTKLRIISDKITANYNDKGELSFCEGIGNCDFIVDDYRGTSDTLSYNIETDSLVLRGENEKDTRVHTRGNTFNSTSFNVDTKEKILSSTGGVKSVIALEKQNVLFSMDPIFINARMFTIDDKENRFSYQGQVNLVQGDIGLNANNLEIADDDKIEASGRVSLTFKSDERDVDIKGNRFVFNAEGRNISIDGNAVIKNDENLLKANYFTVHFDENNELSDISGEGDIVFTKEDIYGVSGKVTWRFSEEILILKDLPQVTKRNGGTTIGRELQIDLKTNKITILSSATERTETIID